MEKKPYHHLPDGTFRNPEGSPQRTGNVNWSFKTFNKEKKKLDMTVPKDHAIEKEKVLSDLEKYKDDDYIAWIGHATYLIKLGDTTIITDPVFSTTCSCGTVMSRFFFFSLKTRNDHLKLLSLLGEPSGFLNVPSGK